MITQLNIDNDQILAITSYTQGPEAVPLLLSRRTGRTLTLDEALPHKLISEVLPESVSASYFAVVGAIIPSKIRHK